MLQLESGFLIAFGCVLYLGTSMLYGMLFELSMSYFVPQIGLLGRLMWCSVLALTRLVREFLRDFNLAATTPFRRSLDYRSGAVVGSGNYASLIWLDDGSDLSLG